MSGKKRNEPAAREEEHPLHSKEVTGKKKPFFEHLKELLTHAEKTIEENSPKYHTHWQIACIMRRAAGLSYSATPFAGWQEDGTPELFSIVDGIVSAKSKPTWDDPKSVSDKLFKLRYSFRELKGKLLSMDEQSLDLINEYADPIWQQQVGKLNGEFTTEELFRDFEDFEGRLGSPDHQTPIDAALGQMGRLEDGVTRTLEDAEEDARDRKEMGQPRTYSAKRVALGVAKYMYQVNDKIPGLWTGSTPSGPYAKALLEIFGLLGIPEGSLQRAGEYAIQELKSISE